MITRRMFSTSSNRKLFGGFLHVMVLVFILGFIAGAPPWAHAQIPRYINYQGKLTDADDNPVTGDVSITIRLYDAATGGTALWTETQSTTVTRGIFSVLMGNTTVLDKAFDVPYWYSVEVESDGEMTPRQRLTAVAYALNADKLDGYEATEFLRVDTSGGSTTGITVSGGLVTAGANENIELNPTGTGNIIMTIDSTSGDFKITDGTTNWLLVDNATGDVSMTQNLTVTGNITLDGNLADTSGAVTIADALTQTGSTNQVTFAGNVDANNGLDVTGNLTVSGTTTLADTLDMNKNIDLDYSGTSAALDINQTSTGAAAKFTGGKVIIGADTSNTNAVSAGELYVQGDMEVDGTIYGTISDSGTSTLGATTLTSLTVTGTSDLQGNVSDSGGDFTIADNLSVTGTTTLTGTAITASGTDDYTLNIAQTLNDTSAAGGSDTYRGIKLNVTETDKTGWNNVYLMDLQVGGTSEFLIADSGNITASGTLNMGSNKITNVTDPATAQDAATKSYVDSITPATAGGWTDGGTGVYLLTSTDNVGVGTTSTGTYKLNVSGSTNTTTLYINGALIASTDLSDTTSVAMLAQDETITGNWVNTTSPWADNEVADGLTISGGTIDNSVIGGTTAAAGTFTTLTANTSLSVTGDSTFNTSGAAALASITQTDNSASLAVATDTTKAGGGAGADSDGVLKLGINEGNYQYIWYDADAGTDTNGAFVFSDQAVIPTASPAYLNFGMDFNATTKKYGSYYAVKVDPDPDGNAGTNVQTFSVVNIPKPGPNFADFEQPLFDLSSDGSFNIYDPSVGGAVFQIEPGGRLAHDFRNLIKNGSFEAFSGFEDFMGYDPLFTNTGVYSDTAAATVGYMGGWDNFAPDEWVWVKGRVAQHSPELFTTGGAAGDRTTDIFDGTSALSLNERVNKGTPYALGSIEPTSGALDAEIKQKIKSKDLEPNTWYSVGAAMMIIGSDTKAILDITGAYEPTTYLTANIASGATLTGDSNHTISVNNTANFPTGGTIKIGTGAGTELFDYNGKTASSFSGVKRNTNPITALSAPLPTHTAGTGTTVTGIFKPLVSTETTAFEEKKGSFKTDSTPSDIRIYLISQQGATAGDTAFAKFDAVQLVEGKVLPKYAPTTIVDIGDQSVYGTLKVGRSASGRGGILAVDQYIRTRGIDFFDDDPGMSGATGGGGAIDQPWGIENWFSNPPTAYLASGTTSIETSGNYVEPLIRKFQVKVNGQYATPGTTFSYRYQDNTDPMREWDPTAWGAWTGWLGNVTISTTAQLLDFGIKVRFTNTSGFNGGDRWEFKTWGMSPEQMMYDTFSKNATYRPGQARIYKDPATGQLTFEDNRAGVVKLSEIISQASGGYVSPPVRDPYNTGTANITAGGALLLSSESNFEVYIEYNNSSKYGWHIRPDWTTTTTTQTWYGNWNQSFSPGQTVTLASDPDGVPSSGDEVNTGVTITFPATGTVASNDRWTFYATPGSAASLPAHTHSSPTSGGIISGLGGSATIDLTPEFPTAVLSGTGNGVMTADFDSVNFHNYYNWKGNAANQPYNIYARVLIPEDFSTWDSTAAITYYTNVDLTPVNTGVTLTVNDTANVTSYTGSKIQTNGWVANTIGSAGLPGTYTKGSYMTLRFTMAADSAKNVKLGEVKLKYTKQ